MTIADDMRAASLGELNRVRAQLKTANEEIEQLRLDLLKANHDLSQRTHGMFVAQEAGKDLARQLDTVTVLRDQWKRIALAYRCDRNEWSGPYGTTSAVRTWSIQRRKARAAEEIVDKMLEDRT